MSTQVTPIPEYYMKKLRARLGLDSTDKSRDEQIRETSAKANFYALVGWELGDTSWASTLIDWIDMLGGRIVWPEEQP